MSSPHKNLHFGNKPKVQAKRIMIFGIPGSGKSTCAVSLAKTFHLPVFHLDKYFFTKGWQERKQEEFLQTQKELVEKDAWIIDGNATKSLEMRYARADLVLYFKFNRLLCLWRIFKRAIAKHPHLSDLPEGCSKSVRLRLIRYLWGFDKRVRSQVKYLKMRYPHAKFYEIKSKHALKYAIRDNLTL